MGQTNDKAKPARNGAARAKTVSRFDGSRFVQYELDAKELAECKGWDLDGDALWLEVLAFVDDGYSVSVKYDSYSNAYACFIQVRGQDDHVNAGLILSGRGSTPAKACKQAIFKARAIGPSWVQYAERRQPVIDD